MSTIERLANDAVFLRQMQMDLATRFVMQNANVDKETARQALRKVMLWYKSR